MFSIDLVVWSRNCAIVCYRPNCCSLVAPIIKMQFLILDVAMCRTTAILPCNRTNTNLSRKTNKIPHLMWTSLFVALFSMMKHFCRTLFTHNCVVQTGFKTKWLFWRSVVFIFSILPSLRLIWGKNPWFEICLRTALRKKNVYLESIQICNH